MAAPEAKVDTEYDYVVIGGGSGGVSSARRAAGHGAKVAVIERARWGGTCVNVGCVPKKVMFNTSHVYDAVKEAEHFRIETGGDVKFDWAAMKEARDKYVLRLNGIYNRNLNNSGVAVIEGDASFGATPDEVVVTKADGSKLTLKAKHVLVACGGKPREPRIEGAEHTITSDGFFELKEQPKRAAVVGGGYIAVELAGVLQGLGTQVTIYVRSKVLRPFDPMIQEQVTNNMKKQGINVVIGSIPKSVKKNGDKLDLDVDDTTFDNTGFDAVLYAVGRDVVTDSLNLGAVGVETKKSGHIVVDDFSNTTAKGVYAVGDVIGKADLTPVAIAAGRTLADRLFNGQEGKKISYDNIPTVVFSHPPVATCGLTEAEAAEKYGADNLKIYNSTWVNLYYASFKVEPADKPRSKAKVICVLPEEKVVGLHCIGMGVDEMMQGFGVAMRMGCTKTDLDSCIAIHPTAAEELVTLPPWTGHRKE